MAPTPPVAQLRPVPTYFQSFGNTIQIPPEMLQFFPNILERAYKRAYEFHRQNRNVDPYIIVNHHFLRISDLEATFSLIRAIIFDDLQSIRARLEDAYTLSQIVKTTWHLQSGILAAYVKTIMMCLQMDPIFISFLSISFFDGLIEGLL